MPKYKVSDSITIQRTWIVEAKSEYGAIDQIDGLSRPAPDPDEEEQIDNTPYEAERIDGETCPACRDELHGEPVDDATIATMCEPCQAIARENEAEDAEEVGPTKYRTTNRPLMLGTYPGDVKTEWVELPYEGVWRAAFPGIPTSDHMYGVFTTDRPLTADEMASYQIEIV